MTSFVAQSSKALDACLSHAGPWNRSDRRIYLRLEGKYVGDMQVVSSHYTHDMTHTSVVSVQQGWTKHAA
jgi:hypothetical protein